MVTNIGEVKAMAVTSTSDATAKAANKGHQRPQFQRRTQDVTEPIVRFQDIPVA